MGNRAVITTAAQDIGVYLHWNGGRDSVEALLAYCEAKEFRSPAHDTYGWARLCQVAGNMIGGGLSLGIGVYDHLDRDNGDNGVYVIGGERGWSIIDRVYYEGAEQGESDDVQWLYERMRTINRNQPKAEQLPCAVLAEYAVKHYNEWHGTAVKWKPDPETANDAPHDSGWISVTDHLPAESGRVAICTEAGCLMDVEFSAQHQLFNARDDKEPVHAIRDVIFWAPKEAILPKYKKEEK